MARKKHTLGCLFYVALVLLVLVIFLFNRKTVQEVIERTGFVRLFDKQTEAPPEVTVTPPALPEAQQPSEEPEPEAREPEVPPEPRPSSGGEQVVVTVERPSSQQAPPERPSDTPERTRTRQARLFYLSVSSDGTIHLKPVARPVEYVDAPLTATLQALLKGPTAAEISQGLMTMIPPETRLRRLYVKDDTAYLDFNEAFRFNSLGKEGLIAQLQQIVYSSTEFSNVKQVQFLIEGNVTDYLGPEGLYIGKPLSRESFRN
ncbi:MAG: GerMN domain-containing protein [Spirochaetales bacterium]|nr:GerMN domain-containing protein [Spirochaetales bacterium]